MLLSEIRQALLKCRVEKDLDVHISHVTADSRRVQAGSLFVALRGHTVDGHKFVSQAVEAGAAAVLVEEPQAVAVPQLVVPDSRLASGIVADRFYNHPSERLSVIGVTGTNGKTTTTHLIECMLQDAGRVTGLLGTIGKRIAGETAEVANTTPEATELQAALAEMVEAGCDFGILEVSSHALEERRVAGTRFRTAVFTNLTQDHLDFHGTMDNYRAAKGKLFSRLGNTYADTTAGMSYAILNADDDACSYMASQGVVESLTYGIDNEADVRASEVQVKPEGVHFHVRTFRSESSDVHLQLTGRFNVYNALAAMCVGLVESIPLAHMVRSLESVPGIPGRLERVVAGQPYTVLVDYAHTPDSLENALTTVQEFATRRIVTVVGCGGDRDRTKRPIMARMALQYSDVTLLTSDNPRTEDPDGILDDMEAGLPGFTGKPGAVYRRITDRRQAIARAIEMAESGDVVLIAGKGHEDYQIIGRTKHHFDDREVARSEIERRR